MVSLTGVKRGSGDMSYLTVHNDYDGGFLEGVNGRKRKIRQGGLSRRDRWMAGSKPKG